jgi:hypothetical protein
MTRHPYRRDCDCDHCFADELNAVLERFLEMRERRIADEQAEKLAGEVKVLCDKLARC